MFLSPMRDDLTVREAGEVGEEPYDMLARHPNHSPDVAVCVHEINSLDHVMTPGMKRTIGSVLSCAVSPSAEKIDTEERATMTLQYIAYELLPQRANKKAAEAAAVPPATPPAHGPAVDGGTVPAVVGEALPAAPAAAAPAAGQTWPRKVERASMRQWSAHRGYMPYEPPASLALSADRRAAVADMAKYAPPQEPLLGS